MLELLLACAPAIHPTTMAAVVQHESAGNPLSIRDNASGRSYSPATKPEAVALATRLIGEGHSVDLGLGQINSRNLPRLGLAIEQVFDPCDNLKAAQTILLEAWRKTGNLKSTLAVYNTGKPNSALGRSYASAIFKRAGVEEGKESPDWQGSPVRLEIKTAPAASKFAATGWTGFSPGWR